MLNVSDVKVPNSTPIVNIGNGNRCIICGSQFDDQGACCNSHVEGQTYYLLATRVPVGITCRRYNGNRCNVCQGFFLHPAHVICEKGHQIREIYPRTASCLPE